MTASRWWIAAPSSALREKPLAAKVQGTPLALFRDRQGRPLALFDRCPHRGYPLSPGTCRQGRIVCGYHGWEFDGQGICRRQPAATQPPTATPMVQAYPVLEQDGYVWVRLDGESDEAPKLYLGRGAWQPWTHVIDESAAAVAARLRAQPGWQAQDGPAAGEVALRWELAAVSTQRIPRILVHLVPETDERTRVEILEGPCRWYDLGPLRFRKPKTGLPDRVGFLQLAKAAGMISGQGHEGR